MDPDEPELPHQRELNLLKPDSLAQIRLTILTLLDHNRHMLRLLTHEPRAESRSSPPQLLPPEAYGNASTSYCSRYAHTSTNKIRCPVNIVKVGPR